VTWLAGAWATLKRFGAWLWSHPAALAGAIGALAGAVLMVRSKTNQVSTLKGALEVQKIKASVARDEAQAEILTAQANVHGDEVKQLQLQITESKRRAVELASAKPLPDGASDEEIAKLFSDAGL
jgi:hypothetical protein